MPTVKQVRIILRAFGVINGQGQQEIVGTPQHLVGKTGKVVGHSDRPTKHSHATNEPGYFTVLLDDGTTVEVDCAFCEVVCQCHEVASWEEANVVIQGLTRGERYTLGWGYTYPYAYALTYKDALSGEGTGYLLWNTKNGTIDQCVASISIKPGKRATT